MTIFGVGTRNGTNDILTEDSSSVRDSQFIKSLTSSRLSLELSVSDLFWFFLEILFFLDFLLIGVTLAGTNDTDLLDTDQ